MPPTHPQNPKQTKQTNQQTIEQQQQTKLTPHASAIIRACEVCARLHVKNHTAYTRFFFWFFGEARSQTRFWMVRNPRKWAFHHKTPFLDYLIAVPMER